MGTPIRKTTAGTTAQTSTTAKKQTEKKQAQNTQKTQKPAAKKREYAVTPDGRKIDVTSVFDQIEKNTQQDIKDQQKFMQDMFGDVL